MRLRLLTAPVVYNGLGTPRQEGALVVQEAAGKERVVAVGSAAELTASYPELQPEEEPFALSPAPVNAHTHLDLSTMPYTPGAYGDFIRAVIAHGRSGKRDLAAARAGERELLAAGTTVVGDIVTSPEVMSYLLRESPLQGVAYWEVLGPDPADAPRLLAQTEERIRGFKALERPGGMRLGLSPHTPHTVSGPLLAGLAALARRWHLPMQIHVAESPAELQLHRDGSGPLRESMGELLAGWQASGLSPVAYLESLGVLAGAPTLVHMIHVDEADIRIVRRHGCSVVHCPQSNAALGCGRFPWEEYARAGVTVAFGTDSKGSATSLDVREQVGAALAWHGARIAPQAAVWSAVKGGYRALGMQPPKLMRGELFTKVHRWGDAVAAGRSALRREPPRARDGTAEG